MRARRARPCTNAQAYGKFGKAVRWHWVRLCIDHNWTASKIAQDFNKDRQFVHHSTIYKCLKIFWRTGDVVSPRAGRRSRPGILTDDDWLYLVSVLDSRPDLLLDEMRDLLESYSGITYSISTLCATLQRHGYTRRVLKQIMVKRDRAEEATFIDVYNRLPADLFVWIDETRKDPHGLHRRHGYGVRGGRTYSWLNFGRGKSFSALAVLTLDGIIDYNITSARGVKAVDFCNMLYHHVIPHMQKWPKRRSILVLDNASIHHDPLVRAMVEAVDAKLVFLPPYAPDLNPIEEVFSKVKAWLERHRHVAESNPEWAIGEALQSITHADAAGYIRHAGYSVEELVPGILYA